MCKPAGREWRIGARGALHAMTPWGLGSVAAVPRFRFPTSQPLARSLVKAFDFRALASAIGASLKQHAAKRLAQPHPYKGFDFSRCKAGAPGSSPSKPLPRPCLGRTTAARRAPQGTSKAKAAPKGSAEPVAQKAPPSPLRVETEH